MRQSLHVLRAFVILLVLGVAGRAFADDRSEARAHYQTAAKLYQGGDYRAAIREFSAAQQLVPADLNNYNLALCYDKLGDAEPAIQYYRAFLDKQPSTEKRAEIEASVARLDAAVKSAASKKAAAVPPPVPVAAPVPVPVKDAPVLGPAVPAPDAAAVGPAAPPPGPAVGPAMGPAVGPAGPPPAEEPRKKKHGPAVQSSGDPQLDRVNGMNIDEIRDQRTGARAEPGVPAQGTAAVGASAPPAGQPLSANQPPPNGPTNTLTATPAQVPGGNDEPKKESPVYKKWWFWAVVAVGGYVVYELATSDSQSSSSGPVRNGKAAPKTAGLTLLSW